MKKRTFLLLVASLLVLVLGACGQKEKQEAKGMKSNKFLPNLCHGQRGIRGLE